VLQTLTLENYKGFSKISLENLKRVNIIAGQNNTGKTSILESIFLFYDRGAPDLFFKIMSLRGVLAVELTPNNLWGPYFKDYDTSKPINITVNDSGHIHEASYNHKKNNTQSVNVENYNNISFNNISFNNIQTSQSNLSDILVCKYKADKVNFGETTFRIDGGQLSLDFNNMRGINKKLSYVPSSNKGTHLADAERLGRIDIEQGLSKIVEHLKIIEPNLNSLSVVLQAQQPIVYCDIGLKRKVPISLMGEGISKLLSILAAILTTESGIVCIDEIENGIHYSLFPKVLKTIIDTAEEFNCQLFITTHSNDVLKGLYFSSKEEPEVNKSVSFYRIDRKNGEIRPKHYTSSMLFSAIDRAWEVR